MKEKLKIRGTIDFYRYLFSINRIEGISLLISLALVIISLLSVINEYISDENMGFSNSNTVFFLLILGFSLFNIFWDLRGQYEEIKKFTKEGSRINLLPKGTILKDNNCISMTCVVPEEAVKGWKGHQRVTIDRTSQNHNIYGSISNAKIAIFSPEINEYLWDNDLKIEIKK